MTQEIPNKFTKDNRVNFDYVQWFLANQITTHVNYTPPTTLLVSVITKNGFHIATNTTDCVDPANFDTNIGYSIALANAMKEAENKLWEYFGWELANSGITIGRISENELVKIQDICSYK